MNETDKYCLKCPACGKRYAAHTEILRCPDCEAPTVVAMNLDTVRGLSSSDDESMWRYFDLLPVPDRKWIVSQSEGCTPCARPAGLAEQLDVGTLILKNETVNPTGSFKDRQISVGISKAKEAGADTIAVVSSGNVAASAASYAAVAGMRCYIFAPSNAPEEKLVQARMYGAAFFKVNTLSSSRIFELVADTCKKRNWHLLSTAGLYNPYQVEGAKTIAYELYESTDSLPDWIVAPVGGGGLIGALWRAFNELRALGKCRSLPRMVGVQSSACTPLVRAIEKNLSPAQVIANPVRVGDTIAGAIADDILFDAYTALPAVRETNGLALSVTDDEMLQAESMLARTAGVFAEPTSAATIAALKSMRDSGMIDRRQSVCCIITGSGFKDMSSARKIVSPPVQLEPSEEAFLQLN